MAAAVGLLGACSDPADPGGENMGGGSAGSAGSAAAGKSSGGTGGNGTGGNGTGGNGSSGSSSTAGKPGTAGSGGGAVAGSGGTAGRDVGGQGGSDGLAGAGGELTGEGGAGGVVITNCEVESLHVKVSGGVNFERSNAADDHCGGTIGGENNGLGVAFFLNPPEVENTLLASSDAYPVTPGTTGTFKAEQLSILATGAIWSMHLPDAEKPLPCSMNVTKYEKVDDVKWRVAGSLSCSAALSGIGVLGGTPLKIEDFTYSIVIDTGPDQ
jgi:hypothetical protein